MRTPAKDIYSVREVAKKYKVTSQTVENWIKAGIILAEKPGYTWEIPAAEVERLRTDQPRRGRKPQR